MSLRKKVTPSGDDLIDDLVDDFQRQDDHSLAESSVLSSLFPIVKSSQVRANAPRVEVPSISNPGGLESHKKNYPIIPKDMDSLTVESGRPIDSVYIYPSEPQTVSHRQRRTYKSGTRSTGSLASTRESISVGDRTVGSILETLGLGQDLGGDDNDGTLNEFSSFQRTSVSSTAGQPRRPQTRHRNRPNSGNGNNAGPQVHLRACMVLFFLLSILYGAFQWIEIIQSNNKMIFNNFRRSRKANKEYKPFDEGEDRPLNAAFLEIINRPDAEAIQLAQALDNDKNKKKPKLFLERGEVVPAEVATDLDTPVLGKEDAPVDTFAKLDKDDPMKSMSLSVQVGLADIYSKDPTHMDIPFLWYIPRSGGGMVKNILSNCKDLVVASEVGATQQKKDSAVPKLEIVTLYDHKYVNVDTTTISGISEAKALGLAGSGMAQLIVSPRLQAASSLFSPSHRARTFAMMRHPIERAVSMFYFLKKHKVPAIVDMSLDDYSKSTHVENNWMVRMLTDRMSGEVGEAELELAKQVLKEKVLIGLLEQKEESMRRFEYYFGWKYTENAQKQTACKTRFLVGDYRTNESAKSKVKEGSQAWSLLVWQNKLDIKLYKYATMLFLQQGTELFSDMP